MNIFGAKKPQADPELVAARQREEARLKEERDKADALKADEENARKAGLRGVRSLLSGGELGYPSTLG